MNPLHSDLDNEQTALCAAIDTLHAQWNSHQMVYAVSDLYDATTRAESMLLALEPQLERSELALQIQTKGLRALVVGAYQELQRAERFARERIGQEIAQEKSSSTPSDRIFPTGTIVSCPADDCGVGLYKVVEPASFEDLVVFDDRKLQPLNGTIPLRNVWQHLACPFCGSRLLKGNKIHTLQYGWA